MISQSPQLRIKTNAPIGNDLFFALPDLSSNNQSYLDADVASGATSLSANGTFFAVGQYIILGQPGEKKSEIVKIATTSATTITIAVATVFSHNRGDIITMIQYNQIIADRSTDAGVNFTPLTAININPQVTETYLQRTGDGLTDVYKYRFFNETSSLYSGYSDSMVASGYPDNSVYAIKARALNQLGEKLTDLITSDFLDDALNEGRRVVDMGSAVVDGIPQRVLRWSFRTSFNTEIGQAISGRWSIAAPDNLRDRNTFKNILGLRIGRVNYPLIYQDRNRFNQNYLNVGHSVLNGPVLSAATSVVFDSTGDFDDSGSAVIAAESVTGTKDTISYTANNLATDTLTGVTGVDVNHATGRDVWQQATFGIPSAYTIDNGMIYFDIPFDDRYAGESIIMDFYVALQPVNSDSDLLDEPFYDLYVPYLKYKIKALKSNGALDPTKDGDYKLFLQGLSELVSQEVSGQVVSFVPSVNGSRGRSFGYY